MMDTLLSLRVFRQVVDSGSFVGAAERLDLSTAMVSRHVTHLERRVGVRLLNRNSRTLSLTEAGKAYFERCRVLLDDLETTELELGSQSTVPRGILRVTAPSWASGQRMADLLGEFRRRCPEVVVDISFEDRMVDLVEEGYDLALRVARDPSSLPPGLISRPLRATDFHIAASRDYIKRNGTPGSAQEFKDALVPVLRDYPLGHATAYCVYVSHRHVPLKIRRFIDFLMESVGREPRASLIPPSRTGT
jgi:DNA-binding transcriptional LysR family regulator